jgi:tetratricopeptide (TPR) repeat protein
MKPTDETGSRPGQPCLSDLFTRYLQRQAAAQAEGLGYAPTTDEVVPHEAVPVQPVDPRQAWEDARAVLPYLAPGATASLPVPPDWPTLVASQEPLVAVAFCLGNYPQLVRHLHPLLAGDIPVPSPTPLRQMACPALEEWARLNKGTEAVLAAGALRLAGNFDQADSLLQSADVPAAWHRVRSNEVAALDWHRGRPEEALARWQQQEDGAPILFNRGMACLFLGHIAEADAALTRAVALLPETSAWHHLGQLYLALARARLG